MSIGRPRKYWTDEEKIKARRRIQLEYYGRNREERNRKNLERYYKKRIGKIEKLIEMRNHEISGSIVLSDGSSNISSSFVVSGSV
jgi:hypothetical protein